MNDEIMVGSPACDKCGAIMIVCPKCNVEFICHCKGAEKHKC